MCLAEPLLSFVAKLKKRGYSTKAVRAIWLWYDFYERRGVNFG